MSRNVDVSFFNVLMVLNGPGEAIPAVETLKSIGVCFKVVASTEEALQILDGERFDMLIVEFSAANDIGKDTVQAIRANEGSFRNVPVLAFADQGVDSGTALAAGAQDFVLKAEGAAGLQAKLQRWANEVYESLPVLSDASIDKIRIFDDSEHTLLNSLLQIYSESTGSEIVEIEQLVKDQDFELLRKKAHKLKSSAAQLGSFRFEKYCNLMEHDPALNQERAQKLFQEMSAEYELSLAEFHRYCQKHMSV